MAIPRSQQIDIDTTPYYHVMTRCVRRTFLCGQDDKTGQDYSHRKAWLVERMKKLSDHFAIGICAFAVMSNHYHLVLHVDKELAISWSDNTIKSRWAELFPKDAKRLEIMEKNGTSLQVISDKLDSWRERLMSISWFMRCLNEPIARQSNLEDEVTGRFWEGRYKSQALLDEGALLAAMVYVDLNPIRAKIALTPEQSEFTSIYERIEAVSKEQAALQKQDTDTESLPNISAIADNSNHQQPYQLIPIKMINPNDIDDKTITIDFKLSDYIHLVDATGRIIREDKKGAIPDSLMPILDRINLSKTGFVSFVKGFETDFVYAVGHQDKLEAFDKDNRQRKIRGLGAARRCYT